MNSKNRFEIQKLFELFFDFMTLFKLFDFS